LRALGLRSQVDGLHGHRTGCERIRDWFGARKSVGRRRQDRVALLEADLNLPIPFGGSSFDAAISLDVVVHLRNRKALFHEMIIKILFIIISVFRFRPIGSVFVCPYRFRTLHCGLAQSHAAVRLWDGD
jgi:hypothetical protein